MFATSVFIAMVNFFLCTSFDLQKERTKERKKEPFFSNRELFSTRKHWTINPSLAQARHRYYRHIAFISFQLKISTPFRKLSPPPPQKKKKKKNTLHSIAFLFCFNSKYHFIFLYVKIMEKWSHDVVDIMHWNCLAWQQSTSSGHPFSHPKPQNCPHQIDPFPARNNPSNGCLCVLPLGLLSANRVSPLNETLFQSTHYQMKWRLAHCT